MLIGGRLTHVVPEEHLYADIERSLKLQPGRPAYNIQKLLQTGSKDVRNYLGQGYPETKQDPESVQTALQQLLSNPDSPAFQSINAAVKSLLDQGLAEAATNPALRKRARRNESNGGSGPPGTAINNTEDQTVGLPAMQMPYYTAEQQARAQMKRPQYADRAMENGGQEQVHTVNARPGWYYMDKSNAIPTATQGYNVPTYDPKSDRVYVRHETQNFPVYKSNPYADPLGPS
jgi:hypothetical protein